MCILVFGKLPSSQCLVIPQMNKYALVSSLFTYFNRSYKISA